MTVLERQVARLEEGKPDVIADRVTRLSVDIDALRRDVNDDIARLSAELAVQRRILLGAFISIATGLILAYVIGGGSVGG